MEFVFGGCRNEIRCLACQNQDPKIPSQTSVPDLWGTGAECVGGNTSVVEAIETQAFVRWRPKTRACLRTRVQRLVAVSATHETSQWRRPDRG